MSRHRSISVVGCMWLVGAVFVSACSSGFRSSEPPVQTYVLRLASTPAAASTVAAPPVLQIQRPTTGPGLDTDRILLVRANNRVDIYAASRWADNAPTMLEALIVDAMRDSGEFRAVFGDVAPFPPDYLLRIHLRRFEADYTSGGVPTVHVVLDAALGRRDGRTLLAAFSVAKSAPAGEDRMSAVVRAFEKATQAALAELALNVRAALQKVESPDPSIKR